MRTEWLEFSQQARNPIIAKVDGASITQAEWEQQVQMSPATLAPQLNTLEGRQHLLDNIIQRKIVFALAQKEKIQDDPQIALQLENLRQSFLIQAYVTKLHGDIPLTDNQIQDYYKHHLDSFVFPNQPSWIGINFRSRSSAKKVEKLLRHGKSFEDIVQYAADNQYSTQMIVDTKALDSQKAAILEALRPGQTSSVLKTQKGFEIFHRTHLSPEPLAKVRDQVIRMIQDEDLQKKIEMAKRSMKIEINEEILKSLPITRPSVSTMPPRKTNNSSKQ